MKSCAHFKKLIEASFTGDLNPASRTELENHLRTCRTCRLESEEYRAALESMQRRRVPPPNPEFMQTLWTSLSPRLDPAPKPPFFSSLMKPRTTLRWAVPLTAVLCVFIGIRIGRSMNGPIQNNIRSGSSGRVVLENRADRMIAQSQQILLAFVNFDTTADDPEILNLPDQKNLAERLVYEASEIKSGISGPADQPLPELLNDLEFILLQIANMEEHENLEIVEMIRESVNRRSVLFKIQMRTLDRPEASGHQVSNNI